MVTLVSEQMGHDLIWLHWCQVKREFNIVTPVQVSGTWFNITPVSG